MKRAISLILILALCISLLSGCDLLRTVQTLRDELMALQQAQIIPENPHLVYRLDQELVDGFYLALAEAERLSVEGGDMQSIEQAEDRLDEVYMQLVDQYQIAYILYCADQTDEEAQQRYLYASDVCAQADAEYYAMTKRVYLSASPVKDQLFADWTQEEIDLMLRHTKEVTQLEQRNTELTVAYYELDPDDFEQEMIPLYNELVSNSNRIARIYGYPDYYTYASRVLYRRDYAQEELKLLRQFAAQYLPAVCDSLTDAFYDTYGQLTDGEKQQLYALLTDPYDTGTNYVETFLGTVPESAGADMSGMFAGQRALFTQYKNAYPGAFTVWIGGEPFCYFGPGYQDSDTVIHELGHYYGGLYAEPWGMSIDVCEVQSQGNEWLFLCFLQDYLQPQVYDCMTDYKLMAELTDILGFVVLDEFEQRIYCHENAGAMTAEDFDDLLDEVAQAYGGIDYIGENILDIRSYWKQVLPDSPVYYLSYAVSSCAALDLYLTALEDMPAAQELYRMIVEEADEDSGFLSNIRSAGLSGPFTEVLYKKLGKLLDKNKK